MIPGSQVSALTTGNITLTGARTAFANLFFGYLAGNSTSDKTIKKFSFPLETISTSSATISVTGSDYSGNAGASNNRTAGYMGGGLIAAGYTNSIQKLLFSADTNSALGAVLSVARGGTLAGMASLNTAAYWLGGYSGTNSAVIDKLPFSTDTCSAIAATLSVAVDRPVAFANGATAGYSCGGFNGSVAIDTINKLTFSTDTRSVITATLPVAIQGGAGGSNGTTAAYYAGGLFGTSGVKIQKLLFSNETTSNLAAELPAPISRLQGCSNNGVAAYLFGGYDANTSSNTTTIQKITYSTEGRSTLGAVLPVAARDGGAYANSEL